MQVAEVVEDSGYIQSFGWDWIVNCKPPVQLSIVLLKVDQNLRLGAVAGQGQDRILLSRLVLHREEVSESGNNPS